MKNTEIIYRSAKSPIIDNMDIVKSNGICKVCGSQIEFGYKEKDVLSGSFTNFSALKDSDSNFICSACTWCIKNPELRRNSFIADSTNLYLLKKNDLEEYLFNIKNYVSGEFVVCVTYSFKKHNSFTSIVNLNTDKFVVQQEDSQFIFDVKELKPLYDKLNTAYLQFSKDEMSTGNYKLISIEQFGIEKFNEYESLFKKHRGTAQFELLIHMLNSEKRNEYMQEKIKQQKELKIQNKIKRGNEE